MGCMESFSRSTFLGCNMRACVFRVVRFSEFGFVGTKVGIFYSAGT